MSKSKVDIRSIDNARCEREDDMIVMSTGYGVIRVSLWGGIDPDSEAAWELTPEARSAITVRLEKHIEQMEADRRKKVKQAAYARTAERTGLSVYAVDLLENLFSEINAKLAAAEERISTLESAIASAA